MAPWHYHASGSSSQQQSPSTPSTMSPPSNFKSGSGAKESVNNDECGSLSPATLADYVRASQQDFNIAQSIIDSLGAASKEAVKLGNDEIKTLLAPAQDVVAVLDAVAQIHPVIHVASALFKLLVNLELNRRDNDKNIALLYFAMSDMLFVLANLDSVFDKEGPLKAALATQLQFICANLNAFATFCNTYYKNKYLIRAMLSARYKGKLAEFAQNFESQKKELQFLIVQKTAISVTKMDNTLDDVAAKMDRLMNIFESTSPTERTAVVDVIKQASVSDQDVVSASQTEPPSPSLFDDPVIQPAPSISQAGGSVSVQNAVSQSARPIPRARGAVKFLRAFVAHTYNHFYTTTEHEMNNAVAHGGYRSEGSVGYILPFQKSSTVPLFRMHHHNGDHFYTISARERDEAAGKHGYDDEGVAGYVFAEEKDDTVPLFRLLNGTKQDHFYTTSADERDDALQNLGYVDEGIAAYVFSVDLVMREDGTPVWEPDTVARSAEDAVQLLRAFHPESFNHFYTTDVPEHHNAVNNLRYKTEGTAAFVLPYQAPLTVPFYRMFSGVSNHFYTVIRSERDNAVGRLGYAAEGTAGYVYADRLAGTVPLYRMYHGPRTDHFFTTSAQERDDAVAYLGYTYEGIAAYVLPVDMLKERVDGGQLEKVDLMRLLRAFSSTLHDHFYAVDRTEIDPRIYRQEYDAGLVLTRAHPLAAPLYRLWNAGAGNHFYTTIPSERARAAPGLGYAVQGTAGFVLTSGVEGVVPLYRAFAGGRTDHFYTSDASELGRALTHSGYAFEGVAGWVFPAF